MFGRIVNGLAKPTVSQVPPVSSFITSFLICETFTFNIALLHLLSLYSRHLLVFLPLYITLSLFCSTSPLALVILHIHCIHKYLSLLFPSNFLRSLMIMGSQPCIVLSFPPKSVTNRMATQYYIVVSLRSIF